MNTTLLLQHRYLFPLAVAVLLPLAALPANSPPAVTLISPTNGQQFNPPASIPLSATASDTEFRFMADAESAWLGVRKGRGAVTRLWDGQKITLTRTNYSAVQPGWPYLRMNPAQCPYWKSVCQQAAGSPYP